MRQRLLCVVLAGCVVLVGPTTPASAQCPRAWQTGLPALGFGSLLYTTTVYDDGQGPALYVGGLIDDPAQALAKLEGGSFVGVGGGLNHIGGGYTEVHALTVYDGELIAAGDFSLAGSVPASNIARWNGVRWAPLGEGSQEIVYALAVHEGRLVAGGRAWDGNSWTALSGGVHLGTTLTLAVYDGDLYAGGDHSPFIARWTGSAWTGVGAGTNHHVEALAVYNGELVAGGWFTSAGGVNAPFVASWNGARWTSLGGASGLNGSVLALAEYDGALVAGGWFSSAAGSPAWRVARWNADGSAVWTGMGAGFYHNYADDAVHGFSVHDGDLIAVGAFPAASASVVGNWGRWSCASQPNQAPIANAGPPVAGQVNRSVVIWGTASSDADGHGLAYYWDYGDGTSSFGMSRVGIRAYPSPGVYAVTLRVFDGELFSAPATTTITITGVNSPPSVTLTSPASGATFVAPAAIVLAAHAVDMDGSIRQVEFFLGTTSLGVDTTSPFSVTWNGVAPGRYSVTAVATDNGGASTASAAISVTVGTAVAASADAFVRDGSSANANFGGAATLEVRTSTSGNTRWTYLTFDTASVSSVTRARLRLFGGLSGTTSTAVRTGAYASPGVLWTESAVTWNTKPAAGTTALTTITHANTTTPRWYEWDVTSYIQQEKAAGRSVVTIVLKNTTSSTVQSVFRSREASSNRPELVLTP